MVDVSLAQLHEGFQMKSQLLSVDAMTLAWQAKYKFSDREVEMAKEVCRGKKNLDIATDLDCSVSHVKHVIGSIIKKTDSKRRTDVILKLMWRE